MRTHEAAAVADRHLRYARLPCFMQRPVHASSAALNAECRVLRNIEYVQSALRHG